MPFVFLSFIALVGADPDRPEIIVEPSGTPIPTATAHAPATDSAAAEAPANLAPTAKRDHARSLQKLHVQRAMSDARRSLDQDDAAAAIEVLEEHLSGAGGADDYLDLLDNAYRRQLAWLVKHDRAEEARLLEERRRVLSSRIPVTVAAAETKQTEPEKTSTTQQAPKPAAKSGGFGGALIGQFFGKKAPAKPETDDKVVVRARWDHRDDAANEAVQPIVKAIPAVRHESKEEGPETEDLRQAERYWKERDYLKALDCYEAAYRANPEGAIQQARERFGYCLLRVAYSKYEPKTADASSPFDEQLFAAWEADVKQGRQLCRVEDYRRFADDQLSLLEERRKARYRAAPSPVAAPAVNPAVAKAAVNAPSSRGPINVAYRHLPTENQGGWRITETENFRIIHRDVALAEEVAVISENARRQAHDLWFAAEPFPSWKDQKCEIVLYPTAQEFAQQTNQMPQSPAFTQCDVRNGWVASRRIELRVDEPNTKTGVLPHEIAHAVFAGQFAGRSPPKWADEGMAVLTEPEEIQNRHLTGLIQARSGGRGFTCDQLLPMQQYPQQVQEFYAHSVGVCRMLVERHGGRERLTQFVRTAVETNDYEGALFRVYQIRGLKDLETRFQQYIAEIRTTGYASR